VATSLPEVIPHQGVSEAQLLQFATRWVISCDLAMRLVATAAALPFRISIISGWRSPAEQLELKASGRPTASPDRSTHLSCPATGADVWPAIHASLLVKQELQVAAHQAGLRVGGGGPGDPASEISGGRFIFSVDWNHLDLGPRM